MLKFLKKKWWLVAIAAVIIIGGLWFWRSRSAAQKPLKTTQPVMSDIRQTLSFSGRVDAHQRVSMFFAGGGKLTYIGAKEGDTVKKWQTLANIDRRALQKTLEKQLTTYDSERLGFENTRDDRKDRTLTEEEKRLAAQDQNALNLSVLDVELRSIAIEDTRLSTPIAGILVSAPDQVVGGQLALTDKFEVIDPTSLYFRLFVDEVDIDQVKVGQETIVRLDARPDVALKAVVEKIAYQSVESPTGTVFPVEIRFVDATNIQDQRVGMNGDAELLLAEVKNVMTLPLAAVSTKDGKQIVKVLKDGKPEDREVQIGLENDDKLEVKSGLSLEDQVVLP
jgi:RND family efflux transporter MFP subunit